MSDLTQAAIAAPDTVAQTVPPPRGRVRWVICGLLFAAVVLSYIDRLVLGVLKPQLTGALWLDQ